MKAVVVFSMCSLDFNNFDGSFHHTKRRRFVEFIAFGNILIGHGSRQNPHIGALPRDINQFSTDWKCFGGSSSKRSGTSVVGTTDGEKGDGECSEDVDEVFHSPRI